MSNCKEIDKVLQRSGIGHAQRFIEALNPDNFELNDFNVEDWILFTYNFAKHVNYFEVLDSDTPTSDWQDFFNCFNFTETTIPFRGSSDYKDAKAAISEILSQFESEGKLTPHLTLFVCFLQLLELSKKRFNKLTKRHLDFYYKEILQVQNLSPTPDQVHAIFELAKKSTTQQITGQTALNANKDKEGKQLIYKTDEELIVNKTSVATFKSIYNDPKLTEFKASNVSNTRDGLEEPLPEEEPYWLPFAYTSNEKKYAELPTASVGFAIASPILQLQEGLRTIEVHIHFHTVALSEDKTNLIDFATKINDLPEVISIYGSGKEAFIGPLPLKITNDAITEMVTSIPDNNQLKLVFQIDREQEALVSYNKEKLLEKYDTTFPLVKFLIDTTKEGENPLGYNFYKTLINRTISLITVKVDVRGAKSLLIENDHGKISIKKPFFPFTTQPLKRSNFYIDYPEMFSKGWEHCSIALTWQNAPDDFNEWYKAYLKEHRTAIVNGTYIMAIKDGSTNDSERIVTSEEYFTAEKLLLHKENWESVGEQILLTKKIDATSNEPMGFEGIIEINNSGSIFEIDKTGPIKLSLQTTFLHELFPRIYALALIGSNDSDSILIPNEPYTPLIEAITIDYTASEAREVNTQILPISDTSPLHSTNTLEAYRENRIQLFHIHPFGQAEEHNYLKVTLQEKGIKDKYDTNVINNHLVPKYCDGGELYIALENAETLQSVALLIQVLEGSENPLVPTFNTNEKIDWSILCSNKWKNLTEHIIANTIDNFLSSGILKFSIPREATAANTVLPENYIWLRARMHKKYDAVCKVIDIHAQAVRCTFENNENELSHLENGLPAGTIAKLITRIPQIKSVIQPYNSFNGLAEESDVAFYRRISERLRHKNRAITLWDYEHLVLQQFPEIYRVKCLNHTANSNFIAAGHVTLILIPDTVHKNVFDIFQPRVSTALLNKVKSFINSLNTKLVSAVVINPVYEEVKVALEVKFRQGYDERFYLKKIEEDIIKFLSPWAFDDTKEITFGITLHRSILIDYLEKLEYVDYLQNIQLIKENEAPSNYSVVPSNPKSILVSAKSHTVSIVSQSCTETPQEPSQCQV